MFTGLIKDKGIITRIEENASGKIFEIETKKLIKEINIDDSIATNGVCLTATEVKDATFAVQAVHVTLEKTNLGTLEVANEVNLELALRASDRLGGHFVQGHINGVGELLKIEQRGENWELEFSVPANLLKYCITEGSIALDGISLTLAKVNQSSVLVSIIPHTFDNTTLGQKKVGDSVNIEVDMMAKYLENLLKHRI